LLLEFGRTVGGFLLGWSTSLKLSHKNKKPSGFRLRVFLGVSPCCFYAAFLASAAAAETTTVTHIACRVFLAGTRSMFALGA
jgi:hypothetical protein